MAHQKTYNAIIFSIVLLLLLACRRESKQETVARWEIVNPVTNAPYIGVPVRLILDDYGGNNPKTEVIWEGKTNSNGIAEHTFNAYKNDRFGYSEAANLAYLGTNGVDYSVIKRPEMSRYTVAKDEVNDLRYEIVPIAKYYVQVKNIDYQSANDKMRYRSNRLYTKPHEGFTNWSPSPTLTSGFYEGCHEQISDLLNGNSDTLLYELEVTKNEVTETVFMKFYIGPSKIDTIKLYY